LRDKKTHYSELDGIDGIGEKRKMLLLSYFGSVQKIRDATVEELSLVPGISNKIAQKILTTLQANSS